MAKRTDARDSASTSDPDNGQDAPRIHLMEDEGVRELAAAMLNRFPARGGGLAYSLVVPPGSTDVDELLQQARGAIANPAAPWEPFTDPDLDGCAYLLLAEATRG